MLGFGTIVFFSVTGITLNHPDWFGLSTDRHHDFEGTVKSSWLALESADPDRDVDRLSIAEFLRHEHRLKGTVTDVRVDQDECSLTWKGPGYAADAIIDRETGEYRLSVVEHGIVPLINDLHKGRDTGPLWSLVIDVSAALMTISAITGFVLLLYIRRKLIPGLVSAIVGIVVLFVIYLYGIP